MKANKIRTMKDDEALFIMANKLAMKLKIKPYYKNSSLIRYTKLKPYTADKKHIYSEIEYLGLN